MEKRPLAKMVHLTRINRVPLVLNADLIEHIDATPDTVISLINGQKFVVRESADDVIQRVIEFRRRIATNEMKAETKAETRVETRKVEGGSSGANGGSEEAGANEPG